VQVNLSFWSAIEVGGPKKKDVVIVRCRHRHGRSKPTGCISAPVSQTASRAVYPVHLDPHDLNSLRSDLGVSKYKLPITAISMLAIITDATVTPWLKSVPLQFEPVGIVNL
jgi:hypothetical protein